MSHDHHSVTPENVNKYRANGGGGIVSKGALTREQFAATELRVRRHIAARSSVLWEAHLPPRDRQGLDAEELRVLDYFVERHFCLERPMTAAYFRSYRQLGKATRTFAHSHEALKRLVDKKILAPLEWATKQLPAQKRKNTGNCFHWYGINLNFRLWPPALKRPDEFWEQDSLPDEFTDTLRETFIELSAGSTAVVPVTGPGRDAGPGSVPRADKDPAQINSGPGSVSSGDSKTELPATQQNPEIPQWKRDLERLKQGLTTLPQAELEALTKELERTLPGYTSPQNSVPPQGTEVYPSGQCTPGGYTTKPNNDAVATPSVPPGGTYPRARAVASLALSTKTKLAMPSVPPEGTLTPEKIAEAWNWLQKVDTTAGLNVLRFSERWRLTCELYPGYVSNQLRGAFDDYQRRMARGEKGFEAMTNPLGWLSTKAIEDGRMERFKRRR